MDASGCEEGKGFLCLQVVPIPLSRSFSSFIITMKPRETSQKAGGLARRSIRPNSSCNRIIMLNPKCAGEKREKLEVFVGYYVSFLDYQRKSFQQGS